MIMYKKYIMIKSQSHQRIKLYKKIKSSLPNFVISTSKLIV